MTVTPKKRSKKHDAAKKLLTKATYTIAEAAELLPKLSTTSFDGTAEIHVRINADTTQADQLVRTTVVLPHGSGKTIRIAAFVPDDLVSAATKAGASIAGNDELIKEIEAGTINFDVAVAHPTVMKDLGKIAKILGQKGLMPNPKAGTVSPDIAATINELKQGRIECRMDKTGIIHTVFGKTSFGAAKLADNLQAIIAAINDAKPNGIKGTYITSIFITPSMGPSIKIQL